MISSNSSAAAAASSHLSRASIADGTPDMQAESAIRSLAVLRQQFFVDARLVIEAFGVSLRREPDEISITFEIFRQQNQMKVCFLSWAAAPLRSFRLPRVM